MEYTEEELLNYNIEYLRKYLDKDKLDEGIKRLKDGEPVQYIVGNVNFFGYIFDIDKRVLIPRFETEELVERTIKRIKNTFNHPVNIIDLGCGSGCISITLKKELPDACVSAVDISCDALLVAQGNALKNDADITFINSDMLDSVDGMYDVIISNPPYIKEDEEIMDVVYNNEPHLALFAKEEGLYFYDKILKTCKKNLNDKFIIAFEMGQTQGEEIISLAHKYLDNIEAVVEKDLSGLDRYVFIINK